MWIARSDYDQLVEHRGQNVALQQRVASLQTTNEWMMMRLTQLEHERAVLVQNYMGVKIPVPEIGTPAPVDAIDQMLRDPGSIFQDVGDKEAIKQGIGWDEAGHVRYDRK